MKTLTLAAMMTAISLCAFAGTDSAPMKDSKDMKDTKQMAQTTESDAGFYVAVEGGANFNTDYGNSHQSFDGATGAGKIPLNSSISSNWGGVAGVRGGYNFNSIAVGNFMSLRLQPAVELEGLWINSNDNTSRSTFAGIAGFNEHFSTNSGDFFINSLLRFKNSSPVTPYIGIGAGMQYITVHGDEEESIFGTPVGRITGLNAEDLAFAAQAFTGFDFALSKHISLFTEYKFVDALGTTAHTSVGNAPDVTYRFRPSQVMQNLITLGVKYNF